jgi:succinate-semialdehyde dehydrogenase/glutarate-semialdehyde dehydrogenase
MSVQSVNPATGEVIESFAESTAADVDRILDAAHGAFLQWRQTTFDTRSHAMRAAAGVLRARKREHARAMTLEMGKPIVQGEAEVEKCAWVCEYYAAAAPGFLAEQPRATDAARSYVRFDPLGPRRTGATPCGAGGARAGR